MAKNKNRNSANAVRHKQGKKKDDMRRRKSKFSYKQSTMGGGTFEGRVYYPFIIYNANDFRM